MNLPLPSGAAESDAPCRSSRPHPEALTPPLKRSFHFVPTSGGKPQPSPYDTTGAILDLSTASHFLSSGGSSFHGFVQRFDLPASSIHRDHFSRTASMVTATQRGRIANPRHDDAVLPQAGNMSGQVSFSEFLPNPRPQGAERVPAFVHAKGCNSSDK